MRPSNLTGTFASDLPFQSGRPYTYNDSTMSTTSNQEKIRRDELTIKQLQDVNFKLMLEIEDKCQLEMQIQNLQNQNADLNVALKDLSLFIEDSKSRAEKERESKQTEFKQVFEELSKCRSELRILKDENSWLQNQKNALEEQYKKIVDLYNEAMAQRKQLLDEKDELADKIESLQDVNQSLDSHSHQVVQEIKNLKQNLLDVEEAYSQIKATAEEQGRLLKKYKATIISTFEMLDMESLISFAKSPFGQYQSLNEDSILENLQPAIANVIFMLSENVQLNQITKQQEEERSQVIYDLQNQLADMTQQVESGKGIIEDLNKQCTDMKHEYSKLTKLHKTLRKELKHQQSVSKQLQDQVEGTNQGFLKMQQKIKTQMETIQKYEDERSIRSSQVRYNVAQKENIPMQNNQTLNGSILNTKRGNETFNKKLEIFISQLPENLKHLVEVYFSLSEDQAVSSSGLLQKIREIFEIRVDQAQGYSQIKQSPADNLVLIHHSEQVRQHQFNNLLEAYNQLQEDHKRLCNEVQRKVSHTDKQ